MKIKLIDNLIFISKPRPLFIRQGTEIDILPVNNEFFAFDYKELNIRTLKLEESKNIRCVICEDEFQVNYFAMKYPEICL